MLVYQRVSWSRQGFDSRRRLCAPWHRKLRRKAPEPEHWCGDSGHNQSRVMGCHGKKHISGNHGCFLVIAYNFINFYRYGFETFFFCRCSLRMAVLMIGMGTATDPSGVGSIFLRWPSSRTPCSPAADGDVMWVTAWKLVQSPPNRENSIS